MVNMRFFFVAFLVSICTYNLSLCPVVFDKPGVYFGGKTASFVVMDENTVINVRNEAERGWECYSIVKDCGDPLVTGERRESNLPCYGCDCCDLVEQNSDWIDKYGDLVIENSNAIVSCCDGTCTCTGVFAGCDEDLINAPITDNISLESSCHINPGDSITVNGDVTIEGNGAMLVFSNPDHPQFIVQDGSTLTLQNITLKQINSNTFDIASCADIKIGKNVLFELSENVTFTTGKFEVIEADGGPNVFTVRGIGGIKQLRFVSTCCRQVPSYQRGRRRVFDTLPKSLHLNYHTMFLQDIELLDIDEISRTMRTIGDDQFIGSIALGGGVIVNVGSSTNLGFVVEGINNEMRVITNNVRFEGCLLYSNHTDNMLHFNCTIPELIPDTPVVRFADNFLLIHSTGGRAGLTFEDTMITVRNEGENSFVVGDHSFLEGYRVEILENPIKQVSDDFELGYHIILTSDQPNAIIFDPFYVFKSIVPEEEVARMTSALHFQFEQEQEFDEILKSICVPNNINIVYNNEARLSRSYGNILLRYATLTDFGIDPDRSVNITLQNGSTLRQGDDQVVLKQGDVLNITGRNNKIIVQDRFVINGEILFEPNTHVLIEFDPEADDPQVVFANETEILLDPKVRLEFRGSGTVIFGEKTRFVLQDRSELLFNNATKVYITGELSITGVGCFKADNGAKVSVTDRGHLIIGDAANDVISMIFDRLATLQIVGEESKVSLQKASTSMLFDRAARVAITDGGELELNACNGVCFPGVLSHFIMDDDANMKLGDHAIVSCAENRNGQSLMWDVTKGRIDVISDTAIVRLVQENVRGLPFAGIVPDSECVRSNMPTQEVSMTQIVQAFLQRETSGLVYSTVFVDEHGKRFLRTRRGKIVALFPKDKVREDASGRTMINGYYV